MDPNSRRAIGLALAGVGVVVALVPEFVEVGNPIYLLSIGTVLFLAGVVVVAAGSVGYG